MLYFPENNSTMIHIYIAEYAKMKQTPQNMSQFNATRDHFRLFPVEPVTYKQTTEDMPDSEEEMRVLSQTGISHEEIEPILSPVSHKFRDKNIPNLET
jgi:hypothetical protein